MSGCSTITHHRDRLSQRSRVPPSLWLAGLALFLAPAAPSRADMFTPSAQDQIKLGNQAAAEVMRKYRVLRDDRARRVEDVGQRLLDALSPKQRGPWDFRFHVIESKEINAFALPGGNVFMFTGLYDRIKSEDELAAVMGHELTHVREQHWAHMAGAQAKRQAGLAVILGLAHASPVWQKLAGITDTCSRSATPARMKTRRTPRVCRIWSRRGITQGMLELFHTLQESAGSGGGPVLPGDHPLTKTRIQHTQERINRLGSRDVRPETPLR